jgi:Y-X(10)_GDL-associated radical SAM protein
MPNPPRRYETDDDYQASRPIFVVWEITLACNLRCIHCGSRAGKPRPNELNTAECLDVISQLARLGIRHVALIGGEAHLRRDWLELVKAIRNHGMDCSVQTGGYGLSEEKVRMAGEAGLTSCGVSLDGVEATHDTLRGRVGSFGQAMKSLSLLRRYGIASSVNTQISRSNVSELRDLMECVIGAGVKNWQIQLTVAMGAAADRPELLIQPYELLELMPLLASLHEDAAKRGLLIQPGNNIGYFGPYEHRWRMVDDAKGHWQGCSAGHTGLGLEADGTIKGCPSLPTEAYSGGNIRDVSIQEALRSRSELRFTRDRTVEDLWGYCKSCYYADVCRAGCTWTNHVLFGRSGNNPFCHYRALELSKKGLRERIVKIGVAPGLPFDHGLFKLLLEPTSGNDIPTQVAVPPAQAPSLKATAQGRIPVTMELCFGCKQYVFPGTQECPHCGVDVPSTGRRYSQDLQKAHLAAEKVDRLLAERQEILLRQSSSTPDL